MPRNIGFEYKIPCITIPNFYGVNFIQRKRIKKIIDKNYETYFPWDGNEDNMNVPIMDDDTKFFAKLYNKFLKTSQGIFGEFTLDERNSSTCWSYRGNKDNMGKREDGWWHNHLESSTINAVYYLQVYSDGISFVGLNNRVKDYLPKNDELLIFPSHVVHAAQPNTLQKNRYSVNMENRTEEPTFNLFSRVF